jgi:hypothetical protein
VERGNPVLRPEQFQASEPQGTPMERREREVGRSQCFRESRKIEHETWLNAKTGELSAPAKERSDVQLVSHGEKAWRTFEEEKANDGSKGWCTQRLRGRVEFH